MHEPLASFKKIDSVWEKLSDGHKILARYNLRANRDDHEMAMQKRTWKLYEGREIYSRLFHEIYESLQMNAINKTLGELSKIILTQGLFRNTKLIPLTDLVFTDPSNLRHFQLNHLKQVTCSKIGDMQQKN